MTDDAQRFVVGHFETNPHTGKQRPTLREDNFDSPEALERFLYRIQQLIEIKHFGKYRHVIREILAQCPPDLSIATSNPLNYQFFQ